MCSGAIHPHVTTFTSRASLTASVETLRNDFDFNTNDFEELKDMISLLMSKAKEFGLEPAAHYEASVEVHMTGCNICFDVMLTHIFLLCASL